MRSPYRTEAELRELPRHTHKAMAWTFRGHRRSVRIDGDTFKRRFMDRRQEARFLSECLSAGLASIPSSFGDLFHRLFWFRSPGTWVNGPLDASLAGGWQGPLRSGKQPGLWKTVDLVSAYAWAALQGLPVVHSARPSWKVEKGGLYVASHEGVGHSGNRMPALPPHLRSGKRVLVSFEECEAYDLRGVRVVSGVVFRQWRPLDAELGFIRKHFRDWKAVFRSYWGRWASAAPVVTQSLRYGVPVREWRSSPRTQNKPWAHYILSRPRIRLAELVPAACHVYIDCATVPADYPVRTGTEIGDWRIKGYVRNPVIRGVKEAA